MDKVKQIFKSDSHHDSTTQQGVGETVGTHHGTHDTTTHGTTGTTGLGQHGTSTTGTTGSTGLSGAKLSESDRNAHGHHTEKPSLTGHSHNIKNHHELPREGEGTQTHDHKHLAAVEKDTHVTHETEEIERQREIDRHVHHVQHHVQPVLDTKHVDREHAEFAHPTTHIQESHVNTDEDRNLIGKLASMHTNERRDGGTERTVIDKGEKVHENVSHHVHHVVQPVVERDVHHHKTIHTTIPIKQTTHEAPIVHQSSTHEPMHLKDFVAQGGDLKSKLTHDNAGVLANGDCERTVDGPAEKLAEKFHLGGGSHSTATTGTTGATGTTGSDRL